MLSKITMVLAFAMAISTVVLASGGASFARDSGRSTQNYCTYDQYPCSEWGRREGGW
jgi:hypothetical protein